MTNENLIKKFYKSFSEGNSAGMIECYHDNIVFRDPAFGELHGDKACNMWRMLLSSNSSETKIHFNNISANNSVGKAKWKAEYLFGEKKRKVTNNVSASFKFEDGKIIEHIDNFNLWKWSQQALGLSGYLMGWSQFMKNKIQKTTNNKLDKFISKL